MAQKLYTISNMKRLTLIALLILTTSSSCTDEAPPETGDGTAVVVTEGKEDDFLSISGREYIIDGRYTVQLEEEYRDADEATRLERVQELVGYQYIAISWFLTQYFIEKEHDAPNVDYGGFGAMAKASTYEELDIRQEDEGEGGDGLSYSFRVYQLIAGQTDLLQEMADVVTPTGDGGYEFVLTIGTPNNAVLAELETNNEWYRNSPWDDWNPENVDETQKAELRLTIRPEVESADAWFDYVSLFADGLLTIDVHFGWDYHNDYHLLHPEAMFGWLQDRGFAAPVETFAELDRNSGPFTLTINADGRPVDVEVRLYWGHPGADTDPSTAAGGVQLEEDMRESLRSQDVIVYSGHSGPFYGFALANWRTTEEGDLDDSEMASVEMPANRYQIIFAEGCDTYHIGEAFRQNPAKPGGAFIDIITTTAPSSAGSPAAVQDMITRLVDTGLDEIHIPKTMKTLLRDLDSNSWYRNTMYGIHGIDDNPQIHPYAVVENICLACSNNDDCGGVGNLCVDFGGDAGMRCAPACTTDTGCPTGNECRSVGDLGSMTTYDKVCTPANMTCP